MSRLISRKIVTARKAHRDDSFDYLEYFSEDFSELKDKYGNGITPEELAAVTALKQNNWKILPGQRYELQICEHEGSIFPYKTLTTIADIMRKYDLWQEN